MSKTAKAGSDSLRCALLYCGITFGITWALWIGASLAFGAYDGSQIGNPVMTLAMTSGMFAPLVGALLTNAIRRKGGRIDLALRPRIRGNVRRYLLAWFVPTVVSLAGATVFFLAVPGAFSADAQPFSAALQPAIDAGQISADQISLLLGVQVAFAVVLAPFVNMIPAFGEEAGWRGMLFPALSGRLGPRGAALAVGVIWGLWHAPITCIGHNYGVGYWGFPFTGILAMVVFCTSASCCLSWLRLRTGSVWPCALAHGAMNAIGGVALYFCTMGPSLLGPNIAGLLAGIPLIALAAWCWWLLPKRSEAKA